ncbi:MAG: glycosyltransferase [Odoribacter splanchnicus]
MTPKVSIIVPIYNAGKFLEKCLDTLVNQTLKDIEIILVLDCPTDGSDRIAREYAEKDPRIQLIVNEQNLNIGLSRNEGLKIARGEYIGFSDHDDWRELDMYEKLYQKAREDQADIAISNFDSIYPDRIVFHPQYPNHITPEELKQEIFSHLIGDWKKDKEWGPFTHAGSMWHMLYKREILEKNNIQFSDNRENTFEDLFFLIQVFSVANKITYLPLTLYHHVYHQKNQENNYIYYSTQLVVNYLIQLDHFLTINRIRDKHLWDYFFSTLYYLWRSLKNEIHHKSYYQAFLRLTEIRKNQIIRKLVHEVPFSMRMARKLKIQKTALWLLLRL